MSQNLNVAVKAPKFSISLLLAITAVCCILIAWAIDRTQLKRQIPSNEKTEAILYRLSNGDSRKTESLLNNVFDGKIATDPKSNGLLVIATPSE